LDLNTRLDTLEAKLAMVNDKVNVARSQHSTSPSSSVGVKKHPADDAGEELRTPRTGTDPQSGFSDDPAIRSFRQASILFDAAKYPESMLAYSAFLERYGDHPLAGTAQFYVGEAYFRQKEY